MNDERCILISSHHVRDLEHLVDDVIILDESKILLQESLMTIGQKLQFKLTFDPQDLEHALYAESVLKGNAIIARNSGNEESPVDLELLYKAIVQQDSRIQNIFN